MATKHEQILDYIETLPVGEKISVRSIAKELNVSEGTAYRAIKDAENLGFVSTIQRVGTIRIERKYKGNIEKLTFQAILKIIEGEVLGGELGLERTLTKFIIGAMTPEAMKRYITPGSLMIVGNREEVQQLAIEEGAAVLITGGFHTSQHIIDLANQYQIPVLSTTYDSFTVATLINRAISDQLIKKEILLVEDIYTHKDHTTYLTLDQTVGDYRSLARKSGHSRMPVVNKQNRVIGIITAKDVLGKESKCLIERVMTKTPIYAKTHMSIASAAHLMIWDGIEMMPVVSDDFILLGIVSRRDVMKAMQITQKQMQIGNTISDQITNAIEPISDTSVPCYRFEVTPQMITKVGTLSFGVLSELVTDSVEKMIYQLEKKNIVIEQMNLLYLRMIQLDSILYIEPQLLELGRRSGKVEVSVFVDRRLVAKAMVACQIMERA